LITFRSAAFWRSRILHGDAGRLCQGLFATHEFVLQKRCFRAKALLARPRRFARFKSSASWHDSRDFQQQIFDKKSPKIA
jgi:hypothetical protein